MNKHEQETSSDITPFWMALLSLGRTSNLGGFLRGALTTPEMTMTKHEVNDISYQGA